MTSTITRVQHPQVNPNALRLFGALAALASGLTLVVLPVEWSALLFVVVAFAILSAITPFAALTIMLVLAPLRTLIATESTIQLPLDIGQIAFVVFIAAIIMQRIVTKRPLLQFQWSPIYALLLIFIVATGLTAFTAASLGTMLTEWLKWLIVLLLIALLLQMGRAAGRWQWIAFSLALAAAGNACVGLYIFFGGSGADHLLILDRFFRAFGTFGQPNPFGGFLGLIAPFSAMLAIGYSLRNYRYWRLHRQISSAYALWSLFYALVTGLLLAGIVASWSRGAWLSLVVAFAVVAFALPRKLWQSVLLALTVMAIAGSMWLSGLLPASVVARISSSTEEFFAFDDVRGVDITSANYAVVERLAHWQAAIFMAEANPWFGVGLGNYEIVYDDYRLLNWPEALGHAHNYYLNIFGEAGIVGVLAYLGLWIGVSWVTWRTRRHPDVLARFACVGLLGTWAYLSAHSFLDNLYVNNLFLHLGGLLAILAILQHQQQQAHT